MKKILLLMLMLISTSMMWAVEQTPPPEVEWEVTDDSVIIRASGEGEVILYVSDEVVENPYAIAREDEDYTVFAYATAQAEGMTISEPTVKEITIPKSTKPHDHEHGCWLLMLDRNNNEIWKEMLHDYSGDYSCIQRMNCYIFGCSYYWDSQLYEFKPIDRNIPSRNYQGKEDIITYDARFCFVIDGVRYGPENNYTEVTFGNALSNPLVRSNNFYTMMTGTIVNVGVAFDDDGKAYAYVGQVGWDGGPAYLSDKDNFPDPHKVGCWLLMLDRNNNEIWQQMEFYDGDYICFLEPYCYIFGCTYLWHSYFCDYTPIDNNIPSRPFYLDYLGYPNYSNLIVNDARVCIVIDGVRYGPEENYSETVPADALANPLIETNNYYTIMTGFKSYFGLAFDDERNAYLYLAFGGFGGSSLPFEKNFPAPLFITGDVNCDNEVNIADVNALSDMILSGNSSSIGDVNGDGEINISDINAIIDIIQGH